LPGGERLRRRFDHDEDVRDRAPDSGDRNAAEQREEDDAFGALAALG
jgi:hypothetical protein